MKDAHRLAHASASPSGTSVLEAWEKFVGGDDHVRGVRPEVAISWHRCREQYRVDPYLTQAPAALAEVDHSLEHDVIFAELGGLALSAAREVENLSGVVTVTDAGGRILATWGDPATLVRAADARLSAWYCWSERAAGTNGMGTALEANGPVRVGGAEHWCEAFHSWVGAGVAVRDVVTRRPIAVLNVSCWRTNLPGPVSGWLAGAVTRTHSTLKRRARDSGAELVAAFTQAKGQFGRALAAVDTAGKVVIADERAAVLMGVPACTPAVDPTVRWNPGLPDLIGAARYASTQAAHNPDWIGSTRVFTHLAEEPTAITLRPVFLCGHLIGSLIAFGAADGEHLAPPEAGAPAGTAPGRPAASRLVGVRESRMVLLRFSEVCFAESDGNDVWLVTDEGRMRAATQGIDKLAAESFEAGFLRVHRGYVVNLDRIREVDRGDKGEMFLVMDNPANDVVPVSRRNSATLRRALGI